MQKIVLNEIVDFLHKAYPDASIGVGGSVATGTYRSDSDVDILFQQKDHQKSFLISFLWKGIKVSIFGFSKAMLIHKERNFLLSHLNMPISFLSNVAVIYDEKGLIADLKHFVSDIIERRSILRYILIDELKVNIENLLQLEVVSCIDAKKRAYAIVNKIIFIFYLKFHAKRIVQKEEGRNPYMMIKKDDYVLYEKLKKCLPYTTETFKQLKELYVNHIKKHY